MDYNIVKLLETALGRGRTIGTNDTELAFKCPICKHHKKKLAVNVATQEWRCWICTDTRGKSLVALLRKVGAPETIISQMAEIYPPSKRIKVTVSNNDVILPAEYKPLWVKDNSIEYKKAIGYLRSRGLSGIDILRYRIGYCTSGKYAGMVIIPSYDASGKLNFYTGRAFNPSRRMKHLSPSVSKNIIGFEHLINWQLPITLCEGAFDAIAIKRNAIPLFGKEMSEKLKISIIINRVKEIYVALDQDAILKILDIITYFKNEGINVYFTELGAKDPSALGFDAVQESLSNNSKELSLKEKLTKRLA